MECYNLVTVQEKLGEAIPRIRTNLTQRLNAMGLPSVETLYARAALDEGLDSLSAGLFQNKMTGSLYRRLQV